MAKDNLLVEVQPALLEAMGVSAEGGKLDYFALLGLDRNAALISADVERAVMLRSKPLRQWQNSPQHGAEAVKLLPLLHRIGAILKDPARRGAYKDEVDRLLSGRKTDPKVEFEQMIRAAAADGKIDERSRAELLRFAKHAGLDEDDAEAIIRSVVPVAPVAAQPAAPVDNWEFSVAQADADGADLFTQKAQEMLHLGQLNPLTHRQLVQSASTYKINPETAGLILKRLADGYFRGMVQQVAAGGVLSDNQARLLMPKAINLGLTQDQAYQILSDFTFTGATQDDLASLNLSTPVFDQSEIEWMLEKQGAVIYRQRGNWVKPVLIGAVAILGIGIVGVVAVELIGSFTGGGSVSTVETSSIPVATPGPSPLPAGPWANPKPDPADGLLAIAAAGAGDPPAFRIKVTEVNCQEYQAFLTDMFYPTVPEGWNIDYSYPEGAANLPVTGVTWKEAKEFCDWYAGKHKLPKGSVRLPRIQEYQKLLKYPLKGGLNAADPSSWGQAGLASLKALSVGKSQQADILYLDNGQVYDLLSNAGEWGEDDKDGKKATLGGDVVSSGEGFNAGEIRYAGPETKSPSLGFRIVVQP